MRLAWPPPRHLIASVLIPVIAVALVHLQPPSLQDALSLPALILVLFIPGYLAVLSLFPGKSDLSWQRRAFLCLVFSVFLAGLFSFILAATPRGLQSASLATILSLLAILLAAVAYGRWSNLPRKRRFLILPKRGLGSARAFPLIFGASISGRRTALAIVLLAACFIAAFAFAFGLYHFSSGEPLTKLEVPRPVEASSCQSFNLSRNNSGESSSPFPAPNSTDANSTSPVILKDKSKAAALNAEEGDMRDDMGGGSSSGSTKTAAKKPASQEALQPEKTASPLPSEASKVHSNTSVAGKNVSGLRTNVTAFTPDTNRPSKLVAFKQPIKSAEHSSSANSNQPPVLKALVPDIASPQLPGPAIFWKAEASDEEGDKILYKYLLNGREVRNWSRINSWSWRSYGLPAGDYQISVLAIDGKHASIDSFDSSINASFTLSRANQAPLLRELKSDKTSPQGSGGMITWTAGATDPDDDTVYYKFMKNGENVTGWSSSNSWIWDTSSEKPGDYRISVQAKDGLHASKDSFDSAMDASFALSSPNSSPEIKELKANRSGPQAKGSVISWNAIAVDPDGDEVSYRFLANGIEVRGWSPSNSWVWDTSFATPGEYRIEVLARDGKHASEDSFDSFQYAAIAILASNEPPVLKALVPDIASPGVQGTTVIWRAQALDPEGDKILYKYQLNGRDMGRWSESASWKWSSKELPAGDYKIRVLARDGKHATEDSFDSSMDAVFTLISEIDQQIEQLMKKRKSG